MQLVRNQGRRNHRAAVVSLLKSCSRAVICSGWIKPEGIKALRSAIDRALDNGAEITIYSSEKETPPEAIAAIPNHSGLAHFIVPGASVYLHSKLYYFERGTTYTALVGSANATYGGLVRNNELSVRFSGQVGDEQQQALTSFMNELAKLGKKRGRAE